MLGDPPQDPVPVKVPVRSRRRVRASGSPARFVVAWTLTMVVSVVAGMLDWPEWWRFLVRILD